MNYTTEDNIDFFSELYKSLDIDNDQNKTDEDLQCCLITNDLLIDHFVTMKCGHKFNYVPLYKDLLNHKKIFNNMESSNSFLKKNEIRCPYCRKKQNELLPYYKELGLKRINGVNNYYTYVVPVDDNDNDKKCQFLIENELFNTTISENETTNPKFVKCNKFTYIKSNFTKYNDTNCYCYTHKPIVLNKYKLEEDDKKQKIKDEKQKIRDEKQKIKDEKQKIKDENQKIKDEKQKIKDEKQKIKDEKQKLKDEIQKIKDEKQKLKDKLKEEKQKKLKSGKDEIIHIPDENIIMSNNK